MNNKVWSIVEKRLANNKILSFDFIDNNLTDCKIYCFYFGPQNQDGGVIYFYNLHADMSGKSRGCYALSDIDQILPPVGVSFGHRKICHNSRLSRSTRERFSSSRECIVPPVEELSHLEGFLSLVEMASECSTKSLLSTKA